MPYKLCPDCRQISYSARNGQEWYCPYCGRDITFVPLMEDKHKSSVDRAWQECYYLRVNLTGRSKLK